MVSQCVYVSLVGSEGPCERTERAAPSPLLPLEMTQYRPCMETNGCQETVKVRSHRSQTSVLIRSTGDDAGCLSLNAFIMILRACCLPVYRRSISLLVCSVDGDDSAGGGGGGIRC